MKKKTPEHNSDNRYKSKLDQSIVDSLSIVLLEILEYNNNQKYLDSGLRFGSSL